MQALQEKIARIKGELASANKQRDSLQAQLRKAELEQARLAAAIAANRESIAGQQRELEALEAKRERLQASADAQRARIGDELRTAWEMGRQGQVKVLLNQESPDTVARALAYYRYFYRARMDLIEEFRGTLAALAETGQRIEQAIAALEQKRAELEQQQTELARVRKTREQTLAKVTAGIRDKGAELEQLEADRKELQGLVEAIREAIEDIAVPEDYQPFTAAKGKMPWPVPGRASARFGNPRSGGKMRWQGVTIPAEAGTPVKAIHYGRVVYADWLRGMGLLLIVDHGDGFLSLYAHNQTLLKEVGEWVGPGTTIATVGDSGGLGRPALYFEVRENGTPVNPAQWCRR